MTAPPPPGESSPHLPLRLPTQRAKARRTLLLLAAVAVAPVVASYSAYYLLPREQRTNYGELLATAPAPPLIGTRSDGQPFALAQLRGKWVLILIAPADCDASCRQTFHATRQARTIQGREMERVQRVWVLTDDAPPDPALLAQHSDLLVARVGQDALASFPAGVDRSYLVDPLGNLVLAFPVDPDIKKVARDIERLLRASRIG